MEEVTLEGFKSCLINIKDPTYGFDENHKTFNVFGIELKTEYKGGIANKGSFGIILKVKIQDIDQFTQKFGKHPELSSGSIIACKICRPTDEDIGKEIKINKMISSKFIPKFYGNFIEGESKFIFLFMEFIEGANL